MDIVALFCDLDNFAVPFQAVCQGRQLASGTRHRHRASRMSLGEVMTILVLFHASNYRTFKHFYLNHVRSDWRSEFPQLVSYSRFVELIPDALMALACFLNTRKGTGTGINFIDSTPLRVCDNLRIPSHNVMKDLDVMKDLAQRGKTSTGWFYGFKLHLVTNEHGELLSFQLTPGNVDDRVPVEGLTQQLLGQLFGDRGYISQKLFTQLFQRGLLLITRVKNNMKNRLIPWLDMVLLRKRAIVETIIHQLKNISQIEHSRHRSVPNYFADIICGTHRLHLS